MVASAFDLNDAMLNAPAHSATQTMTTGNTSFTVDLFREGEKTRMDMNENDQAMSVVIRMDEGNNFMLMHELKVYQELSSKRLKQYQSNAGMEFTNQQQVGSETVNGYDCKKYTAQYRDNDGNTGDGTYWVNSDNLVVRAEWTHKQRRRTHETILNLTNIQMGDQDDSLFELPQGYNSLGLGNMFRDAMRGSSRQDRPVSDQERAQEAQDNGQYEPSEAAAEPAAEEGRGKKARKVLGRLLRGG